MATLDPLKSKAQQLRRFAQRNRTPQARKASLEASIAYQEAISAAKRAHWHTFLASLTPSTLFTASRFTTRDTVVASLPVPPLLHRDGTLTGIPSKQADLLFQGTSAPTIHCDLTDASQANPQADTPDLFTPADVTFVVRNIQPDKAPGADRLSPHRPISYTLEVSAHNHSAQTPQAQLRRPISLPTHSPHQLSQQGHQSDDPCSHNFQFEWTHFFWHQRCSHPPYS